MRNLSGMPIRPESDDIPFSISTLNHGTLVPLLTTKAGFPLGNFNTLIYVPSNFTNVLNKTVAGGREGGISSNSLHNGPGPKDGLVSGIA